MLSELGVSIVINLFSFEKTYIGRGLFLIFVGALCLDHVNEIKTFIGKLNLSIGVIIMVYGIMITAIGCGGDNEPITSPAFSKS